MKKRNRNRKLGKQRRPQRNAHRPRLEDLEPRRLLAGDLVLGPGNVQDIDQVGATSSISELELADDAISVRITNDTFETAQRLDLGFGEGQFTGIDIQGELIEPTSIGGLRNQEEPPQQGQPPAIDDGSILLANRVNHQTGNPIQVGASIGNSVQNGVADGDFYEFEDLEAGQVLTAHLDIPLNGFLSTATLVLYNQFGQVQQVTNALDPSRGFGDTYMNWTVETDGDYYIAVIPYNTADTFVLPSNPFRDSTVDVGSLTGAVPYTLTVGVDAVDVDYYAVELNQGDIFGVSSIGAGNLLSLYDSNENLVMRSGTDHSSDYPSDSPLPAGGAADLSFVASEAGTYYLAVEGYEWARYLLETRVFRPVIESAPQGTRQVLFLDFDGAEINPSVFGSGEVAIRQMSPLSSFLPGWGLNVRDESELIDKVIATVDRNLNGTLQQENPDAGVIILNSRDHADPFGSPFVSRVVIGGTAGQSTILGALGLANSLDVGNFDLEEDSYLVLDTLSSGNTLGASPFSLNTFQLADGFTRVDIVAAGIAGMVSHEAGHFFGGYHTAASNDVPSLMDSGGPQAADAYIGVGQDRIFGTADDVPVTFAVDQFAHDEGSYFGINNTVGSLANVLISGKGVGNVDGVSGMTVSGTVFNDSNANGIADTNESGVSGIEVFVDLNQDQQFSIGEPAAVTNSAGTYTISGIPGVVGSLDIYAVTSEGQSITFPAEGGYSIAVGSAIPVNASFGITGEVGAGSGLDLSDAPESYGVASHEVQSEVSLGPTVDPDETTAISDLSDDGVALSNVVAGSVATGTATANTGGFASGVLNGWLDFNQDGTFSESERIVSNLRFSGTTAFSFPIPEGAVSGTTWARFRYGYIRDVAATGASGVGEVEDYPVIVSGGTTGGGDGGGTTVTAPFAVDDVFSISADQASVLALLNNDSNGSDPNTRIDSVGTSASGGTIQIDADGQSVTYSPAAGFEGMDSFTYSISNSAGTSSANVSVTVEGDGGPVDNGGDLVEFRLEVTDLAGAPITNIAAGEDFLLRAYTDDLREGGAGVYAAYLDVEFDADLVSATGPVAFGPEYPAGQTPMGGVIVNGTADGELDDYGAFAGFTNEIGEDERLLFSVPMNASQDGTVVFTGNPADNLPLHEVLLFDIAQEIPSTRIDYGTVTLTIGDEVEQVAAFTNPVNSRDVNNDGTVSPRDALVVINALNNDGAGPLSRDTAAVSSGFFVDVNGDDNLSALDVLMIINALNNPAGEPDAAGEPIDGGAIAAAAVDAALDAADDEEDDLFA